MILDSIVKRATRRNGYGLFATRPIARGTITMMECTRCRRISATEARRRGIYQRCLSHAPITRFTSPDFLHPCDHRIYFGNHSCAANTLDTWLGFDVAARDIAAGEEVTTDYRRFFDPTIRFRCRCGARACCGEMICMVASAATRAAWDQALDLALARMTLVAQPLLGRRAATPVRRVLAAHAGAEALRALYARVALSPAPEMPALAAATGRYR
jgi:hypothetical protein